MRAKKLLALLLVLVMIGSAAPAAGIAGWFGMTAAAQTYSGQCGANGGNVLWSLDTETAVLTISGEGPMANYQFSDYTPWSQYSQWIASVVIQGGVTTIGNHSFADRATTNLSKVTIGDTVTSIGEGAFESCKMLSSITVPDSVTNIGSYAFKYCSLLARVIIGKKVTSIADEAFSYCTNLASLTLGGNVRSIGNSAFAYCTSLVRLTIPDSVLSIGNSAFESCTSLTSVTLGSGLVSIGASAFSYCTSLPYIHIPAGVEGIGANAFNRCDSLMYVCCDTNDCYAKEYAQPLGIQFRQCDGHGMTCSHEYTSAVTTPATCTSDGVRTFTCSKCGRSYTEVIKAAHTEKKVRIEPTCTESGAEYIVCDVCGETLSEVTTLPKLDHAFGAWVTVTEATTDAEGLRERVCSLCGSKEAQVLPKIVTKTVTDESSGVSLTYAEEAYEGDVELSIDQVFDGAAFQLVELNSEKNAVFDITTTQDGAVVQPNGKVTVRIPIPAGFDPAKCAVYHVSTETGKLEKMNARHENGFMVFETDHFSFYAILIEKTPVIAIRGYAASRAVDYRAAITFAVDPVQNPRDGAQVRWFIDGQDQGAGETYTVKEAKKDFTVQAKYILDGQVLAESETETVKVNAGFFARLKAFFRGLFGKLPKVVQEYLGAEFRDR